jgi:hypothetical protein
MLLLIDGYNLLYAIGVIGSDAGPAGLERSRRALLNFLAESLPEEVAARTTVVFDATDAPPGLPRHQTHRGITVRFAAKYDDADTLIEELIGEATAPRSLTVVSSDHRLQRAARRRRARPVDSDLWYAEIIHQRRSRRLRRTKPGKPPTPLSGSEIAFWLAEFDADHLAERIASEEEQAARDEAEAEAAEAEQRESTAEAEDAGEPRAEDGQTGRNGTSEKPAAGTVENPFPPGYAEDLFDDLPEIDDPFDPFPPGYGEDLDDESK